MLDQFSHRIYSVIKYFSSCLISWSTCQIVEGMPAGKRIGNIIDNEGKLHSWYRTLFFFKPVIFLPTACEKLDP